MINPSRKQSFLGVSLKAKLSMNLEKAKLSWGFVESKAFNEFGKSLIFQFLGTLFPKLFEGCEHKLYIVVYLKFIKKR